MTATVADAADSPPYAKEMAPRKSGTRKEDETEEMEATKKKGANNGEDNSPRSGAKKNLSLKGEGSPRSPSSSAAPKFWQR